MNAQREMSLVEWVDRLPTCHAARKELNALQAQRDSLAERLREAREALGVVKKEVNERRAVLAADVKRHESSKDGCKYLAVDLTCYYCMERVFAVREFDDLLQNVNPYIDEVLSALAPPSAPAKCDSYQMTAAECAVCKDRESCYERKPSAPASKVSGE